MHGVTMEKIKNKKKMKIVHYRIHNIPLFIQMNPVQANITHLQDHFNVTLSTPTYSTYSLSLSLSLTCFLTKTLCALCALVACLVNSLLCVI